MFSLPAAIISSRDEWSLRVDFSLDIGLSTDAYKQPAFM